MAYATNNYSTGATQDFEKEGYGGKAQEVESLDHVVAPSDVWSDDDPRMKKLRRKVDIRICLSLGLMYCISLLDRTNLGNAVVAGMGKGLVLIENRYSLIVLAFFPTYVVFQLPATVIIKKVGPRIFLPLITILWGTVMVIFGLIHKWTDMVALRAVLGIFEAGLFPGAVFLLSTWYKRHEVAVRNSVFYLIGTIASGFGGILAYGIQQMDGIQNKAGWRWIFIIEGCMTIAIGIIGYFAIVDFPEKAYRSFKFLTPEEIKIMNDRVELDRHDAHTPPFVFSEYMKTALDWKIWIMAIIFGSTTTVTYATAYFLPIILREGLGFNVAESQCLIAPLYVVSGLCMFTEGVVSDRMKLRAPFIVFNCLLSISGLCILGFAENKWVKYFGAYLVVAGANSNIPFALTFQQNNIVGQWKRAFCSGTIVGFGGIGGIVGSLIFKPKDSPHYWFGLYSCMLAAVVGILCVSVLVLHFVVENKKQRGGKILEKTPGFRFTY